MRSFEQTRGGGVGSGTVTRWRHRREEVAVVLVETCWCTRGCEW